MALQSPTRREYEAFKRVILSRKKPRVEQMIDGVSDFIFLDDKGKSMLAYQWEKEVSTLCREI